MKIVGAGFGRTGTMSLKAALEQRIYRRIHDEIIWGGNLKGVFEDREKTMIVYREWIEEVKRTVPAERLLVFNVREGWKPLCDFLSVPVPEGKPFPHINERKSFQRVIRLLKVLNWLVPIVRTNYRRPHTARSARPFDPLRNHNLP